MSCQRITYREIMEKFVSEARDIIELKRFGVLHVFLAHYGPQLIDRGADLDRLYDENERLTAIVNLIELKRERDALLQAAQVALDFVADDRHGTLNADMLDYSEKRERAASALRSAIGDSPTKEVDALKVRIHELNIRIRELSDQ